jgi:steroid 5-alpha reductase family enzyme
MELFQLYLFSGELIIAMMTALWVLSLILKNSSIVDIFWGTGFVLINFAVYLYSQQSTQQALVTILVTLWGLRLSIHIFLRNHRKPEDFRYAQWRKEQGSRWLWISFFKVFLLQGILMWIIAAPLLAVQTVANVSSLTIVNVVGIAVWAIGYFFEVVSDYQLVRFKSNAQHHGKLLTSGLWHYSRHPNYFGDTMQWWGFYILATASGYWWTIFSPVIMTLLLLRVSGVTLLEKTMKTRPGYEEYIRTTNAFIPWIPRHS